MYILVIFQDGIKTDELETKTCTFQELGLKESHFAAGLK